MESIVRELVLEGLDCANCAAKIEKGVNEIEGVKTAKFNFITKILTIELNDKHIVDSIVSKTEEIVNKYEPDVTVLEATKEAKETKKTIIDKEMKMSILKLALGGIIFILAELLELPDFWNLGLFLLSFVFVGGEVLLRAVKNILKGQVFDENFLMAIATVGAFAVGEYPEGVAVMLFYQIGELFQDIAVNRSRSSIASLMDIRADYANLISGNEVLKVSPEDIKLGDIIQIKPGEKIPLDGVIIEGYSSVDTSALTGEAIPRDLKPGDDILSGFINKNGVLKVKVTKKFGESTVAKILELVQNASSKKAQTEKFITKFARYYTPAVVISALMIAVLPPIFFGGVFSEWLYRALIFLVISCPCALVISIPLGFFGGIGGASKKGILIKGSNYLEALNNIETVVFDKTGTLTKGSFRVTEIEAYNISKDELLEYAAYAESYSSHPIATSIINYYGKQISKEDIKQYDEVAGHGVRAIVKGDSILVGNSKLLADENINCMEVESLGTVIHVAVKGQYSGYLVISDEVKEDSREAILKLKKAGVKKVVMLTGDNKRVADKIGQSLQIDEVYSELLPHEKVEKLEMLEKQKSLKGKLVFVGDGVNDAPVLARADIGIAMGGLGSDAAIEAADVVLMTDEPSKLITALKIAKKTKQIVWQNIIFAFGVKLLVLALGAGGIATMWEAVFADVGVAVIAILNSMRVMYSK